MNKMNTRILRNFKAEQKRRKLQMLTCYDYQTAQMLNETSLDMILVGDSLGNVILGYENTIKVSLEEMTLFSSAVKRGAKEKFVVADLPFGTYSTIKEGIRSAAELFQKAGVEAVKLEGGHPYIMDLVKRLTEIGIPVMGHIGLTPQSVHEQGGYYTHGKDMVSASRLIQNAKDLEKAGVFSLVLECVHPEVAAQITDELDIPTIGIGAGEAVDGHVLVTNDLLKMGPGKTPKFCTPIINLYELKQQSINTYLKENSIYRTKEAHSLEEGPYAQ